MALSSQNYYPDPDDSYNIQNSYVEDTEEMSQEESYLKKQAQALKDRGLGLAKQKLEQGAKKAVKKAGRKIIKKAGKKLAKKAGQAAAKKGAKIAAKAAAKKGAQAALSATGYGTIAAAAIEVLDWGKKALAWAGKQIGLKIGWKEIGLACLGLIILPQIIFWLGLVILVLIVIVGVCRIPGLDLLLRDICGGLGM